MTVYDKFKLMLTNRGMAPNQAELVMEIFKKDSSNAIATYWDDPADSRPRHFYILGAAILGKIALGWIDKHVPNVWFRPMFLPPRERKAIIKRIENGNLTNEQN